MTATSRLTGVSSMMSAPVLLLGLCWSRWTTHCPSWCMSDTSIRGLGDSSSTYRSGTDRSQRADDADEGQGFRTPSSLVRVSGNRDHTSPSRAIPTSPSATPAGAW